MIVRKDDRSTTIASNPITIIQHYSIQLLLLLILLQCTSITIVHGGIIKYDLMLLPKSGYIQFDNGVIRAPGTIDLSDLTFTLISSDTSAVHPDSLSKLTTTTITTTAFAGNNLFKNTESKNDKNTNNNTALDALRLEAAAFAQESSNSRNLNSGDENDNEESFSSSYSYDTATMITTNEATKNNSPLQSTTSSEAVVIDVAVFRVPDICSKDGCDWAQSGVGKRRADTKKLLWCCSPEAIEHNLCTTNDYGRLLINNDLFRGNTVSVTFNSSSTSTRTENHLVQSIQEYDAISAVYTSGTYIVLFSNCNQDTSTSTGTDTNASSSVVKVIGNVKWKSHHGYLPGELFPFLIFHACLLLVYTKLFSTFTYLMKINSNSRIDTEKWIYRSISMGFIEMIFRYSDYLLWNTIGTRSTILVWIGILVGTCKHGISRCLLIMVSMGWGVTRDTLGSKFIYYIVLFGSIFIITDAINYSMIVFAISRFELLHIDVHSSIIIIVNFLSKLRTILDIILVLWVIIALQTTINFLRILDQTTKLTRMCQLRTLFIGSIIINICIHIIMFYIELSDINNNTTTEGGIVQKRQAWISSTWTESNYLLILIGIAILWRPNPNARQYVYTMELPTTTTSLPLSSMSSTKTVYNHSNNNEKERSDHSSRRTGSNDDGPRRSNSSLSVEGRLTLVSRSNSGSKEI